MTTLLILAAVALAECLVYRTLPTEPTPRS